MRTILITLCCLLPWSSFGHEGPHEEVKKPLVKSNKLIGEVVDLACFLGHDGRGAKHAKCALACLQKGNPVAILADGLLYAVVSSDHEPPNARLAPFVGKQVAATGTVAEKNGLHFIDLDSVEAAPSTDR